MEKLNIGWYDEFQNVADPTNREIAIKVNQIIDLLEEFNKRLEVFTSTK